MSENVPGGQRRLDGPVRRPTQSQHQAQAPADTPTPTSDFSYRRNVIKKPKHKRHWKLWLILAIVALLLATGGFLGLKTILAANRIITKAGAGAPALNGTIDPTKLKGEGDGRVNILLLGIGGEGHDGADLSDTMMIMSIDPKTKDVAMLSIPRDLYVKIPGYGYGKINSANSDGGPALAEKVVETVTGVPIHYYIQVDFSGFKQAVDAVGGVDINVKTALYDPAYPCETGYNYCPYKQAAGQFHMTGLQALRYARCRHDDPSTGANCGNDTGRAERQQEVLAALRKQALSAGTLTNPLKISSLIDAIGDHVKTDLQLGEMKELALIAKDVDTTKIVNRVLEYSGSDAVLTSTSNEAGSVLIPKAGEFNYTDIQNLAHSIFVDHYITGENALIQVQNASGMTGLAGTVVTSMKASHYNVMDPATAATNATKTVIYDLSGGKKPYTINYLQQRFGVTAQRATSAPATAVSTSTTTPASTTTSTPDIVIVLGSDYAAKVSGTSSP